MATNNTRNRIEIQSTNDIYINYKEIVAELIAIIEVYEHDLPESVMAQMGDLFQTIALYETEEDSSDKAMLQHSLKVISEKTTQILYKHAIHLLIKKICEQKRLFRHYNYKGVMVGEENFYIKAKKQEEIIVNEFSTILKDVYKHHVFGNLKSLTIKERFSCLVSFFKVTIRPSIFRFESELYLPLDKHQELELKDTFEKTQNLIDMYNEQCPEVIKNGTKRTLTMSILMAIVLWAIPIMLSIPVVVKIIEKICA